MGLISSVQTLLHYSSLHQVCSYSYTGFKEFPPLHTVRNIWPCCPSGWHIREQSFPSLKQPLCVLKSRKPAHSSTQHQLLPPKSLCPQKPSGTWREASSPSTLSQVPCLSTPFCYFFLSLLGFCQKKEKQPTTSHWSVVERRATEQGAEVTEHLMYFCICRKLLSQGLPEQQPRPVSHLCHINWIFLIDWFWNRSGFLTPTASLSNELPCLTHTVQDSITSHFLLQCLLFSKGSKNHLKDPQALIKPQLE